MISSTVVVFDWDGTLIDSAARIISAMQQACDDVGLSPPADDAIKNIIGLGLSESIYALFPDLSAADMKRLSHCYAERFVAADQIPSPLFAGVEEALIELKDQNCLLAVATGKSRRGLNRVLDALNWQHMFDASRCADETRSKPDPMMLNELVKELGVDKRSTLMVGDTEYDLCMASAAGVTSIGVSYGAHDKQRLLACDPMAIIDQFVELPLAIKNWRVIK